MGWLPLSCSGPASCGAVGGKHQEKAAAHEQKAMAFKQKGNFKAAVKAMEAAEKAAAARPAKVLINPFAKPKAKAAAAPPGE